VRNNRDWLTFRPRAFILSAILVAISGIGLFIIYQYEPLSATARPHGAHLSHHLFGLLQTLLTTTLSIGGISLLFEYLLRKSWAEDLLRFLRLNVVVAKSGIQHVGEETTLDWSRSLPQAVEVQALVRDPSKWLQSNLSHLLTASQRHAAKILIGVPDPEGPHFAEVAACVGLTPEQLGQFIEVAVQTVEAQWAALKPHLNGESVFRIVTYKEIPLFEVVAVDNLTFCFLSRPVRHVIGNYALVIEFFQDSPQYPAAWLREVLEPLEKENELLLRDINT
jgi:hypothetical protein